MAVPVPYFECTYFHKDTFGYGIVGAFVHRVFIFYFFSDYCGLKILSILIIWIKELKKVQLKLVGYNSS